MTDGINAVGTIHFALMALLAAAVIVAIIWGIRQKRTRVHAQREVETHAGEAGIETSDPAAELAPAPVAPAPPPLAGQPAPGTPPVAAEPLRTTPPADEPIAVAVASEGTTATLPVDSAADASQPASAEAPLTHIKGLGPKVAARMTDLGIERVGQLAVLDDAGIRNLDAQMGPFTGRLARDRWVEQARLLAAGDRAGFEQAFGKLG